MIPPVLELNNISRSWQEGKPVFSGLNLQVSGKGITVLLGPSGCGKSTLLRCAASLDIPEEGTILVAGKKTEHPNATCQLILQGDNQLLPWLTVNENIAFPVKIAGTEEGFSADSLLAAVGLAEAGGLYPAQLSGGMKQRVVLARALAAKPSILLLDEPFAALDTIIRSRLQSLIQNLNRNRNTSMLLVTHDVTEALILGDVIVFMDANGRLSTPEENPLKEKRDPGSLIFHKAITSLKSRYEKLLDPVDF